jgi:hypothetical protein
MPFSLQRAPVGVDLSPINIQNISLLVPFYDPVLFHCHGNANLCVVTAMVVLNSEVLLDKMLQLKKSINQRERITNYISEIYRID